MATNQPATEEQWQAESDARTIMEAEVIKADEKRFKKAVAAAKKMKALEKLADSKMDYPSMNK
jgi:hypothetical protein